MRIAILVLAVAAMVGTATVASAQVTPRGGSRTDPTRRPGQTQGQLPQREGQQQQEERGPAPLRGRVNAGPCPYVKILYDAARYVELTDNRARAANVGFTGEIEGLTADCSYRGDEPITVDINMLFNLGRGPQAEGDRRTYRYWIAVTERNNAILTKEYIDLDVDFDGETTASVNDSRTIVIPRANSAIAGGNFEVLVGFDVTREMAEFNRSGSRFTINAGQAAAATPPTQ